ncbi:hypothetical protein [Streptomyces buecherae]|uniref:hypothetical protein n=1 Tax=Streptomyces buecherae TaxID=2763006 RepID=UPI00164D13F6|nr:hypothetical protein [Streptomyces buecherae]QNJ42016.1 hypothetical protein H7H31_21280 [Streptomyces buecherae]
MSEVIKCRAARRGRAWYVDVPGLVGVYGHGRTLKRAQESIEAALTLVGESTEVALIPTSAELDALRAAEEAYETALREAVKALALRQTTRTDIAQATHVTRTAVRKIQDELAKTRD